MDLTLVIGGARSGKSGFAERQAADFSSVLYLATAQMFDPEMEERVRLHRLRRPSHWTTLEVPGLLESWPQGPGQVVLLECLSLWVSNLLLSREECPQEAETLIEQQISALLELINSQGRPWIVVTSEVGLGVVPPSSLGRRYRDLLGQANQRLAAAAAQVYWLVAGLPVQIKARAPLEHRLPAES